VHPATVRPEHRLEAYATLIIRSMELRFQSPVGKSAINGKYAMS
jgi:hypothetical protein